MLKRELSILTLLVLLCLHDVKAVDLITCGGETASLTCAQGTIKVLSANYGRTNRATCSTGRQPSELSNVQCTQSTSLSVLTKLCDGKQDCFIPATHNVFGDPCVGTYKYLNVSYICAKGKTDIICQDKSRTISCAGNRRLNIQLANYGRRDTVTCPGSDMSICFSTETGKLQNKCNGKKSCQLRASNSNFNDRCPLVQKYLEVTYSCE